jgi:hypothetical protein
MIWEKNFESKHDHFVKAATQMHKETASLQPAIVQ